MYLDMQSGNVVVVSSKQPKILQISSTTMLESQQLQPEDSGSTCVTSRRLRMAHQRRRKGRTFIDVSKITVDSNACRLSVEATMSEGF